MSYTKKATNWAQVLSIPSIVFGLEVHYMKALWLTTGTQEESSHPNQHTVSTCSK